MRGILVLQLFLMMFLHSKTGFAQAGKYFDKYNIPASAALLSFSITSAHLAAPDSYNWITNSISQLGAQNYALSGIMNSGFISFGAMISSQALSDLISNRYHWTTSACMMAYGTSVLLTGFFSAEPFESGISFCQKEANIHGLFANIAGFGLTGAMVSSLLTENDRNRRILHISGLVTVLATSAMFRLDELHSGTWQRMIWLSGISWLTLNYTLKIRS